MKNHETSIMDGTEKGASPIIIQSNIIAGLVFGGQVSGEHVHTLPCGYSVRALENARQANQCLDAL